MGVRGGCAERDGRALRGSLLLHIIARGKIGRSPEAELVERYLKRIAWPTKLTELPESGGKPLPPAADNSVTILLDEKGEQLGSVALARKLEAWRDGGRREARFLIGGADGFGETERRRRTCCSPSARRPGRTSSPAQCSPNNCSAQRACLRTTPIIGKDEGMRAFILASLFALTGAGAFAAAGAQDAPVDAAALAAGAERGAAGGGALSPARGRLCARHQRRGPRPHRRRSPRRADRGRGGRSHRRRTPHRADRRICRPRSVPGSPSSRGRSSASPRPCRP